MIRVLLVNEMRLVSNMVASVLEDEPDIFPIQMYPNLYPFSISRYIDTASTLCYAIIGQ